MGFGSDWTEQITAVTNRATYTAADALPSGGTDYFTRIREGESNLEWVELQGTLTVTNKVAGSNEVVRLLTPDGTVPRMALVGDHSWRCHYLIPTNAIGGELAFRLVTKEYYTNDTAATSAAAPEWLVRTNTLYTAANTVTEIPYTARLAPANPNDISVILDSSSTHLKIEYNDAQHTFSLSHASYQDFNLWTDAGDGYRVMTGDGDSPFNPRSWIGWNIHTEGWDGAGGAGRFAYLPDWPDGLSCSLNFSARAEDNNTSRPDTLGIGLGEPDKATEYATQNPFVQSAVLANGIGTVSFRARLFDTNAPGGRAVVTLYGGTDPSQDQVNTEGAYWHVLTNFVVTSPTYQAYEWTHDAERSDYQAIRLEMAGARWGRYPSALAAAWEWDDLGVKQEPVNRVFIDDVSVSEVVLPFGPSAIAVDFGGQTINLSTEWVSQMMGRSTDWVEGNHAYVKASLESPAANGRLSVVECYALGLDPEVATDDLVITEFPMKANGTPDLANLKYEPSADKWNLPGLTVRVLGAPDLAGPWQEVQDGDEASLRFFKVEIVAP